MAPVPLSPPIKVGHIDDVQELRKGKPTTIPERFVRDMTERPEPATALSSPTDIPIIDLSKLVKGNKDEILQLATACEKWGFFQVRTYTYLKRMVIVLLCKLMFLLFC
jgi:hypothetical protein